MFVNENAQAPPSFIDRVRDLIAKVFGSPGRAPHGAEPATAGSGPTTARPADKTMRATATGREIATA